MNGVLTSLYRWTTSSTNQNYVQSVGDTRQSLYSSGWSVLFVLPFYSSPFVVLCCSPSPSFFSALSSLSFYPCEVVRQQFGAAWFLRHLCKWTSHFLSINQSLTSYVFLPFSCVPLRHFPLPRDMGTALQVEPVASLTVRMSPIPHYSFLAM